MKKAFYPILMLLSTSALALQGGPSQPDYTQFEPSGVQDMVSLLTGDFTYQIPLGDVPSPYGNYPLSLSYHAGVSPQQEASWVGLGWSLNPGVINRTIRGVPDDQFHGGTLGFIYQYSSFMTWTVDMGYSIGAFSVGQTFSSDGSVGYSATVGYKIAGVGSVGFTIGSDEIGVNASLGLNKHASVSMGVSYSGKSGKANAYLGAQVGADVAHLGAQYSTGGGASANVGFGKDDRSVGLTVSSNGVNASYSDRGTTVLAGSNGVGMSVAGSGLTIANSYSKGQNKVSTAGFAVIIPTYVGVFSFGFSQSTFEYWMRSSTSEYLYGYMYQAGPAIDVKEKNKPSGIPLVYAQAYNNGGWLATDWKVTQKGKTLESLGDEDLFPAYDVYSVSSEGVSGTFRPYARENHALYRKISDKNAQEENVETYSTILTEDSEKSVEFVLDDNGRMVPSNEYADYAKCNDGSGEPCSAYGKYKTYYRNNGNRLVYNSEENEFEERSGIRFLFAGESNGFYESENVGAGTRRDTTVVSDLLLKRSLKRGKGNYNYDYALYGSKKIKPIFEDNNPTGKLQGFEIVNGDGTRFIFGKPVKSYLKVDYSINQPSGTPLFVDDKADKTEDFFDNLVEALTSIGKWCLRHLNRKAFVKDVKNILFKKGELREVCKSEDKNKKNVENVFFSYSVDMNSHATQWLLTEIRGGDFVQLGQNSIGYNVKFNYTEPSIYKWRTPYARPGLPSAEQPNFKSLRDGFTPEGCDSKMYQASFGIKENVYLKSIETATHKVEFILNTKERVDGKGWEVDKNPVPIFAQAALKFKVVDSDKKDVGSIKPEYIYFNTDLPQTMVKRMFEEKKTFELYNFSGMFFNEKAYSFSVLPSFNVSEDKLSRLSLYAESDEFIQCTELEDLKYGRYKLKVKSVDENYLYFNPFFASQCYKLVKDKEFVASENADERSENEVSMTLFVDWGELVFAKNESDLYENQMRYLEKIKFSRKGESPYKIFEFKYDYSLHPRTLNSYCFASIDAEGKEIKGYPETNLQITSSKESADVGICDNSTSKSLYGKLTLKSIKEMGCQNGKCASLPPFKFDYNSKNASSTRISDRNEWIDHLITSDKQKEDLSDFDKFTEVDASILASSNAVDEYGFWSQDANDENHKVSQYFADYGASSWSLNKVVEPTGGVLEVEYERDNYSNAEFYGDDYKTADILDFNKCSKYKDNRGNFNVNPDDNRLCIRIGELYWKEQCLGPRSAYWTPKKPLGYAGNGFDYLKEIGVEYGKRFYYNLKTDAYTTTGCGFLSLASCDRNRAIGILGDGVIQDILEDNEYKEDGSHSKLLVLDRDYERDVYPGLLRAAQKIDPNPESPWEFEPFENGTFGTIWPAQEFSELKGGDLRVSRLSRRDINLNSQTVYDYGIGEIAQLADSAYTTVMGNRFNSGKISYALPDVNMKPKSRIVGFNDDDLVFVPGSRITYPVVNVHTSSNDGNESVNGRTEFKYITPETGIPSEYIDDETKKQLVPFLKLNVRLAKEELLSVDFSVREKGEEEWKKRKLSVSLTKDAKHGWIVSGDDGTMFKFELLDASGNVIGESVLTTLYEKDISQVYFYSPDIKKASLLRITEIDEIPSDSKDKITSINLEGMSTDLALLQNEEKLTSFNEMMISIKTRFLKEEPVVRRSWFRSQKDGFYPILYKKVVSSKKYVWRPFLDKLDFIFGFVFSAENDETGRFVENDVVSDITYYDFTSFLGLNYKTTIYRGTKDAEIPIKVDSSIYLTKAPNVVKEAVNESDYAVSKMGQQIEHWTTTSKLDCNEKNLLADPCFERNPKIRHFENMHNEKFYSHIMFPVFQIGSVTYSGNDNLPLMADEDKKDDLKQLMNKSELRNYRYDPLTGLPTVTLAKMETTSKNGEKRELRKATVMTPYYILKSNPVADSMFVRNMISQNYMEEVYYDTTDAAEEWKSILHEDEKDNEERYQNLIKFSVSPYKILDVSSKTKRNPIVAWGNFTNKVNPAAIRRNALELADASKKPSLEEYSGETIESVDGNYKVLELKNAFGKITSMTYSSDGLHQLSVSYPSKKENNALIVPYAHEAFFNNCEDKKDKFSVDKGSLLAKESVSIECSIQRSRNVDAETEDSVVVEYRKWNKNNGWQVVREVKALAGSNYAYSISLTTGERLNYLRMYPKNAETKTFVYDLYGNLIQIVAEDNTSTYYEYDPFGKLVQSRNDDGVSFKSHHREYMNNEEN